MAAFRNYTTTPRRSDEVHYNSSYAWLGGDYNIGEWHLRADVDRGIITLNHPAFHMVRMAGDKAREIFEELDDLYAADDLPAEDVWERYLSQYIRFTTDSRGVQARRMVSRYKSRSKRARVADSDAGSDKLYTMPFKEMDKAFSTGLPNGYKFIGTGVSFFANKRTHTVDFRNTNVSEDEDGAIIPVPYDSNTGTVAQVKQDLATMVAGESGKVSDAGHGVSTKPLPHRESSTSRVSQFKGRQGVKGVSEQGVSVRESSSGVMDSMVLPVDASLVEKYGDRRVSSFSTADITSLFSAIFKSALQFKGYGSSFSFHKGGADSTARTLDFDTSILAPEGDETLTLEVPYDLHTSTISDVVEKAQRQYAKLLTSSTQSHPVSDAGHGIGTKYQPRRVSDNKVRRTRHGVPSSSKKIVGDRRMQDSNESAAADYDDVLAIFTANRLSGFLHYEDGRIFVDLSTAAAQASKLTDLPYDVQVTFEAEGVEDDVAMIESKVQNRESVAVSSAVVSLLKRADSLSKEWDELLYEWYIPAGKVVTRANVMAIVAVFKRIVSNAPETIDEAYSLLRSGLQSFEFHDDRSSRTHEGDGDMSVD